MSKARVSLAIVNYKRVRMMQIFTIQEGLTRRLEISALVKTGQMSSRNTLTSEERRMRTRKLDSKQHQVELRVWREMYSVGFELNDVNDLKIS